MTMCSRVKRKTDRGFMNPFPDKLYGADRRLIFDAARFSYLTEEAAAPHQCTPVPGGNHTGALP